MQLESMIHPKTLLYRRVGLYNVLGFRVPRVAMAAATRGDLVLRV